MKRRTIENVIFIAVHGTSAEQDALESKWDLSLSSIVDECWEAAEDLGDTRLAERCERAYNNLTDR